MKPNQDFYDKLHKKAADYCSRKTLEVTLVVNSPPELDTKIVKILYDCYVDGIKRGIESCTQLLPSESDWDNSKS